VTGRVSGQVVVVTGAASGLGEATARLMHAEGATVVLTDTAALRVILSTTSIGGLQGGLGPHIYGAAKGAVVALTKNVAGELGAWSIRVNAIAPGKILTPMNAANVVGDPEAMDEAREAFMTRTPLRGRIGVADDIAHAARWLASDDAGFVSGHTLVVDGGLTTGSRENVAPGEHGRWASRRDLVREAGRSGIPVAADG